VDQRVDEMLCTVSELAEMENSTHMNVFGTTVPKAKLDMSQLVVIGHSFGGITAIIAASKLGSSCKACCVMDPWLYAYEEEFNRGEIKVDCPLQIINIESFHPLVKEFDSWKTVKSVLSNSYRT
jgi:pimeloyl-ACP methyl ester carboxylesterase